MVNFINAEAFCPPSLTIMPLMVVCNWLVVIWVSGRCLCVNGGWWTNTFLHSVLDPYMYKPTKTMSSWKSIFTSLGFKGFFFISISDDLLSTNDHTKWMIYDGKKKTNESILASNTKHSLYWMYLEIFLPKS